jgi:hypothetical protein
MIPPHVPEVRLVSFPSRLESPATHLPLLFQTILSQVLFPGDRHHFDTFEDEDEGSQNKNAGKMKKRNSQKDMRPDQDAFRDF